MTKRDCQECFDLLGPYLDRELDETGRTAVEEHLKSCPDCRKELAAFQTLHQIVKEKDTGPRLSAEFWDWHRSRVWMGIRAGHRLVREPQPGPKVFSFRWGVLAGGAAIALVVVIAGWQLLQSGAKKQEPTMIAGELKGQVRSEEEVGGATAGKKAVEVAAGTRAPAPSTAETTEVGLGLAMQPAGKASSLELKAAGAKGGFVEVERGTVQAEAVPAERSLADEEVVTPSTQAFAATARLADSLRGVVAGLCEKLPKLLEISDLPTVSPDETVTVLLRALVEPDGSVSLVRVEHSSGVKLLDTIAVSNVQRARFTPGIQEGQNVRCWVEVPQYFRAEQTPADQTESSGTKDK